ncbi:MAG: hypothetical protein K8H86_13500 [Ignavibacteriaceae bacterium]|nr:hypothetical protein [Ignavibacteriaceae bacterium]
MAKKKEIAEEQKIEKLAGFGLTNKEISEALGYDENTLKRNFEIFLIKGRGNLRERLRRKQLDVALRGNVAMLIWLGKQYLNQAEKTDESGNYSITIKRKVIGSEVEAEFTKN